MCLALWYWVIKEWISKLYDYSYLIYPSFRSDFWNLEVQDFRIFTCHCSTGDLCYDPWRESAFYFNIWSFELDFLEIWVWVCFGIFKINSWITVFFPPSSENTVLLFWIFLGLFINSITSLLFSLLLWWEMIPFNSAVDIYYYITSWSYKTRERWPIVIWLLATSLTFFPYLFPLYFSHIDLVFWIYQIYFCLGIFIYSLPRTFLF